MGESRAKTRTALTNVHQHGYDDVVHESEALSVGEDGVPQPEHVLQVELAPKKQTHPTPATWHRMRPCIGLNEEGGCTKRRAGAQC